MSCRTQWRIRSPISLAIGIVLILSAGGWAKAQGQASREISDRWNIRLGYTATDTKTDLAAGNVLGAVVRIEEVLDFDERDDALGVAGFYRFGAERNGKHSIAFNLTTSSRDSSGVISGTVDILDREFVGAFESEYDTRSLSLAYRLSMVRTDRAEAGILAGLSLIDYSFKLVGEVDTTGDGTADSFARESADFLAPLPTFGLFLKYAITPNLIFDVGAASLDLEIGDLDGRVLDSEVRLTWYFTRNLGVGISVGGTDVRVTNNEQGNLFKVDYQQTTATLSMSAVF